MKVLRMKVLRSKLLKSVAVKVHDMLFAYMARTGAVLCVADAASAGTDTLLTAGAQDTTAAATGEQTTADTPNVNGAQPAADTAKPDGQTGDPAGKGEEGKTPEGEQGKDTKDGDKPAGAPEAYEPFKMPEGYAVDEQLLGEFTPVLKELNLTQEAAQKVMDFAPKLIERTVAETQAAVLDQVGLKDHATWAASAKADKEFGGEQFAANLATAKKAIDAFGTPELRDVLRKTGLGNHPEFLRAFYRAGKAISEDSFVPGGKNTSAAANPATRLYDASNMNP